MMAASYAKMCLNVSVYVWVSDIAKVVEQVPPLLILTIHSEKTCWGQSGLREPAEGNVREKSVSYFPFTKFSFALTYMQMGT